MENPIPRLDLLPERGALPASGGRVHALLRLDVDFPAAEREREPLSLALVVDRSGSMGGEPLAYAKESARTAVMALRDGDRVAVVAYDDQVDLVVPSTPVTDDRHAIVRAIESIGVGGTTALHAGWVEGCTQVLTAPVASGLGRVVLLSDGQANAGITDPAAIAADVGQMVADGVNTSTIGLGHHFNEQLMRHLADAGGGSYTFVESPDQLPGLFATELAGLSALRGRDVRVSLLGRGVRFVSALGGARIEGDALRVPDLIAGLPRELLVTLAVEPAAALTGLRLTWSDVFSRREEALDVSLDVTTLPDEELEARPATPALASALRVADLGERVATIERLAREARLADAEGELQRMRADVADWPEDAARDEQLGDLALLLHSVRRGDVGMSQKQAHKLRYERDRGYSDKLRTAMRDREALWTDAYKAAKAPPPARRATPTSFTVVRADGTEARVEVVVGDLTDQAVDAIVNPTNRGLFGTAGVDGAIHRRGGPELTEACRAIGGIKHGQAVVTPGFRLAATRVIHTTTLPWKGGGFGELKMLANAYAASFDVARRLRLRTLALPAIGTGDYGYPLDAATEVAVEVALQELQRSPDLELVRFVPFEARVATVYLRQLAQSLPTAVA